MKIDICIECDPLDNNHTDISASCETVQGTVTHRFCYEDVFMSDIPLIAEIATQGVMEGAGIDVPF